MATRKPTKPKPRKRATRADSYYNLATGLGVAGRDPATATQFTWAPPIDAECAMMRYEGSPYAARIVDALPNEAMRRPIYISVADKEGAEQVRASEDMIREHKIHEKLSHAAKWGRATGGGALLMVTDDGALEEPLDLDEVTELKSTIALDRRALWIETLDLDADSLTYGEPLTYRFWPAAAGLTPSGRVRAAPDRRSPLANLRGSVEVHRSRLVVFGGAVTSRVTRQRDNQGWDDSILRKLMGLLTQFESTWQSVPIFVRNLAQATMAIKNLKAVLAAGGEAAIQARLRLIEYSRAMGIMAIDADMETFEFKTGAGGEGIVNILHESAQLLAGAIPMPSTVLLGESPAGFAAGTDPMIRGWYAQVESWQTLTLKQAWEQVLDVAFAALGDAPDSYEVGFAPLWSPTDQELAQTYLTTMQADQAAMAMGQTLPNECARSHFSPNGFRVIPQVDPDRVAKKDQPKADIDPMTALNGAQVASMVAVINAVAKGELPRDTGVQIMAASFPIEEATAEKIMGEVGRGFVPTRPEKPVAEEAPGNPEEEDGVMARLRERAAAKRMAKAA